MSVFEERLRELQQLRAKETITESEYQERHDMILDQLSRIEAPRSKGLNALQRVYLVLGVVALAAIVFLVGFGVLALVLGSCGISTSSVGSSVSPYEAPTSSEVANGDIAARVSIARIDDPAVSITGEGKAPAGKRYITIQTALENVGNRYLKAADFRLRTWEGHEYAPKIVPEVSATDLAFLKDVPVGGKSEGTVAFEVPENATVQWLRYRSNPSGIEMPFGQDN
jgi:hypothetical protein